MIRVLAVTNLYPSRDRPDRGKQIEVQVESLRAQGLHVDVLVIEGWRNRLDYLRATARVRSRVWSNRYDLIHAHYGYSGWVALCQRRVPVVWSFLGSDLMGTVRADGRPTRRSMLAVRINRVLARRAAAVIVMSESMKEVLRLERAHVIPTGVDLEIFRPLDERRCRRELGLADNRVHLLFAGNPAAPAKRLDLAWMAVERLLARGVMVEMHVIWGRPHEELALWMNACHCLVHPSWSEGSPTVVKEAMACNLPVVATETGDLQWLLSRCEGNRLLPHPHAGEWSDRQAERLADAVREVAGGRTRCRDGMEELSLESVARRMTKIFQEACTRRRRAGSAPS